MGRFMLVYDPSIPRSFAAFPMLVRLAFPHLLLPVHICNQFSALSYFLRVLIFQVQRYSEYFKMSNYEKVLDGQPLVFLFGFTEGSLAPFGGSKGFRPYLDKLSAASKAATGQVGGRTYVQWTYVP